MSDRHQPLLTPAQAASLLDQVIYEQVLECVDLDALIRLELSLVALVGDLEGLAADGVHAMVRAMLDRAIARLPEEMRRYLLAHGWQPYGRGGVCKEGGRAWHARGRKRGASKPARPPKESAKHATKLRAA